MRSEEREGSPEGNQDQREDRFTREREEDSANEVTASEDPPEENDEWDFLDGADDDFEADEDSDNNRSNQSGVASQTTRATIFEQLKRRRPDDQNAAPGPKRQARQEDCIRRVRSAVHCRRFRPKSIWDYETKAPWVSAIPAYFERRALRENNEQGHSLQWYATGEIAAQLLTEAVSLLNLAQEIRSNSAGRFLTTALTNAAGQVEITIPTLRNEVARHFDKKNDKGPIVDLGPRQKKLTVVASRLYDLKDCISSIIIKKAYEAFLL